MATLTDTELLAKVKAGLGIAGDYQDETLKVHIDEVKAFMLDAGVPETVVNSTVSVGAILCGVDDLWSHDSGNKKLSNYFKERVAQLSIQKKEEAQ